MNDPYEMTTDKLTELMHERAEEIAFNTEALVDEYVQHEGVMLAYDTLIERVEKIATTQDLKDELGTLRALRQKMDRLLFTDGSELRSDEATTRFFA